MKLLKNKTITYIHLVAMLVMLIFVLLFTTLVIYEKYNDFEKESASLRKTYIKKQKESVYFDINRVVNYIRYEYEHADGSMDVEKLKLKLIDTIEHLYGREDGTGYIFIYDFSGVKLSDPIQSHNIGKNLYNLKDSTGVEVIKSLINIAKTSDDKFVQYHWIKPTTGQESLKISHAKAFEPWGWMVGTGVYLDEVEKLIDAERVALKKRLIQYVMEILSLTVILFGIGLIGVIIINHIIGKEIDIFSNFFKKASKSYTTIDDDEIHLLRFKKMVVYVNSMVSEIHKRKDSLQEMNLSLEKKVEEKTEDLGHMVKAQDSFIKHAIHEINTPLAIIVTHIDMFKIKNGEDRYLSKIEAGSKMISTIFDDLSYMVKKERFVYNKEWIDFTLFLKGRIEFFDEIALGHKHKIIEYIDDNIQLYFSPIELQRIIDNNLSNAIKYAKKETDIVVTLIREKQGGVSLQFLTHSKQIADTQRIFEAFHQEEHLKGGFGLGLDIVHSICEKESVELELRSDEKVTIFSYRFRITPSPTISAPPLAL